MIQGLDSELDHEPIGGRIALGGLGFEAFPLFFGDADFLLQGVGHRCIPPSIGRAGRHHWPIWGINPANSEAGSGACNGSALMVRNIRQRALQTKGLMDRDREKLSVHGEGYRFGTGGHVRGNLQRGTGTGTRSE